MGKKRDYGGSEDSPDACFGGLGKIDDRFGQGIATLVAHPTATHFIFSDAQIFEAMFASVASFLQTHGHTHTPEANPIEEGPSELPEGRLPPFARW